ncbi:hypothetical protein GP486_003630, partial [Trichoglossum hirsutum]
MTAPGHPKGGQGGKGGKRRKNQKSQSTDQPQGQSPKNSNPTFKNKYGKVSIIGYKEAPMKKGTKIKELARDVFETIQDSAEESQVGDSFVYGNGCGIGLLQRFDQQQAEINSLKSDVQKLKGASDGYLRIRRRALATYQRDDPDKSRMYSSDLAKTIAEGNKAAHGGDAVTDAGLFDSGIENNAELMIEIYGLSYSKVLSLDDDRDYESIKILNARATIKLDKRDVPQEVEDAWKTYISLLEKNEGKCQQDDLRSEFKLAHDNFWKVHEEDRAKNQAERVRRK